MGLLPLSLAIGPWIMIGALWFGIFLIRRWIYGLMAQRASSGQQVARTGFAHLGVGTLGADITLVAQLGKNAQVHEGLTGRRLKPTIGVRLISFGLSGLVMWLMFAEPGQYIPDDVYIMFPIVGFLIYGMLHTNLSYLRYDSEGFEVMDSLFRKQHVRWRDLIAVRDNGHYLYVFEVTDRRRVQVLKFLGGMPQFLTTAFEHIDAYNRGDDLV